MLKSILAFIGLLITTWLLGFFNEYLPSSKQAKLAIENVFENNEPNANKFRLVLCWLDSDHDGKNISNVILDMKDVFKDESPIEIVRSARALGGIGAKGNELEDMQSQAGRIMEDWNADILIGGVVRQPYSSLDLRVFRKYR